MSAPVSNHPPFKDVEASRPAFDASSRPAYTKTPKPDWTYGQGANDLDPKTTSPTPSSGTPGAAHIPIDPYAPGRPAPFNYKLLISSIVPRPIAFLSTVSSDGTRNLAPFSYFNVMSHDPPLFVVGIAAGGPGKSKDTLRHLEETGQAVINIIGEGYIEAANSAAVNAPPQADEWLVSGLTPLDSHHVSPPRVGEAVFSIEAKVDTIKHYDSRARPGNRSSTVVILEGLRFWAREDAINEDRNAIDPAILRPVSRLGGITYSRSTQLYELPRLDWDKDIGGDEGYQKIKEGSGK